MKHAILLSIYIGVNSFLAGVWYSDRITWAETKADKFIILLRTISYIFGAIPMLLGEFVEIPFRWLYKKLELKFQIGFFLTYYSKEWRNLNDQQLYNINYAGYKFWSGNNLHDKIYQFTLKKINQWNNYTYHHEGNTN